jgi:hypothetical protein
MGEFVAAWSLDAARRHVLRLLQSAHAEVDAACEAVGVGSQDLQLWRQLRWTLAQALLMVSVSADLAYGRVGEGAADGEAEG